MALSCFLKLSSGIRCHAGRSFSSQLLKTALPSLSTSKHRQVLVEKPAPLPIRQLSTGQVLRSADHAAHDHVTIWKLERVLSIALLPLIPAALVVPCTQLDTVVALLIVMHNHWGLEAIVVDYVRPILFGEMAPKIGMGLLYLFSILTLAGLLNLIYNDIGLANTFLALWKKPEAKSK